MHWRGSTARPSPVTNSTVPRCRIMRRFFCCISWPEAKGPWGKVRMARVKLIEQEQYTFHYPVRIEPQHLSIGNHLGADNLILLASAARADVFRSMGLTEVDLGDGVT